MNLDRNGWKHDGAVGVRERDTGDVKEDAFTYISFDDDEADKMESPAHQSRQGAIRRRKRIAGASLFLLVLIVAGAGLWMIFGRSNKTKINVPVRDNAQRADQAARSNDDVTAQAIAEVRGSTVTPTPAVSASPAKGAMGAMGATSTIIVPTTPVTVPIEGIGGAVSSPPTEATTWQQGGVSRTQAGAAAKSMGIVSERNPEHSIRCAPTPLLARQPVIDTSANVKLPGHAASTLLRLTEPRVVLPPFGVMLPVRTLGALYTLRQSLARFELMRDMRGQGWQMKKGTVLIGRQQGSEYDRAYISLMGFIDPASGRLVKLSGDLLGADGAPGLKGKQRQVSSRWARILSRAATSAVSLGQAALSRGGGTTVILPGSVAPELPFSSSVVSRREFVEVPASTSAFVMITDLPKEAKSIDADPSAETGDGELTDDELAGLLESGSPEKIRAALPKMNPDLRQIAEAVLKQSEK
ncbi:MAG: hypothetical protein MOB07_17545 [Acidobacteria bacterium]|nr:hypothetical protein [Acidobacteriota bacterium]